MGFLRFISELFSGDVASSQAASSRAPDVKKPLSEKYRSMLVEHLPPPRLETTLPVRPRERLSARIMKKTDYDGLTCNCEPWHKHRSRHPITDSRRLCSHLRLAIDPTSILKGSLCPEIEEALIGNFFPRYHFELKVLKVEGEFYYLLQDVYPESNGAEWVNVLTKSRSGTKVQRFGFSLREERWSFGESPPRSPLIKHLISESFRLVDVKKANSRLPSKIPEASMRFLEEVRRAELAAEKERKAIEADLEKHTRCYVCDNILPMRSLKPMDEVASCKHCGSSNYRTNRGEGLTVERLEIYRRYDGNWGKGGLFAAIEDKYSELREQAKASLSPEEYKAESRRLTRERRAELDKAEDQKSREIKELLQREKALRAQYPRVD